MKIEYGCRMHANVGTQSYAERSLQTEVRTYPQTRKPCVEQLKLTCRDYEDFAGSAVAN